MVAVSTVKRVQVRKDAEPGAVFAPGAFDANVGREVPFFNGSGSVPARVLAAQVAEDGSHVLLTLELPAVPGMPDELEVDGIWDRRPAGDPPASPGPGRGQRVEPREFPPQRPVGFGTARPTWQAGEPDIDTTVDPEALRRAVEEWRRTHG